MVNWLTVPGYMAAGLPKAGKLRGVPFAILTWPGVAAGRWLVQAIVRAVS